MHFCQRSWRCWKHSYRPFLKPFQLFRSILNYVSSIPKAPSLQCWFQSRENVKDSCNQVKRMRGMLQCRRTVLCFKKNPWPKPSGVKKRLTVGSPFFGTFPSDHIPRATKDVNVHFFTHSTNSCKLYQRIPETFWSYYVHPNKASCYVARNYAASIGNFLPTFRDKLLVPSWGEDNSKERSRFLAQNMKPIGCPE